ncbi:MAG: hypothetical protein NTX44_07610 [Ignavibacteriales bacterium]|nr:hypothetical protein [Ignavibacteriales bacterium]
MLPNCHSFVESDHRSDRFPQSSDVIIGLYVFSPTTPPTLALSLLKGHPFQCFAFIGTLVCPPCFVAGTYGD